MKNLNKCLYRLRGFGINKKNSVSCGTYPTYFQALQISKELILNKKYEKIRIERIALLKNVTINTLAEKKINN